MGVNPNRSLARIAVHPGNVAASTLETGKKKARPEGLTDLVCQRFASFRSNASLMSPGSIGLASLTRSPTFTSSLASVA